MKRDMDKKISNDIDIVNKKLGYNLKDENHRDMLITKIAICSMIHFMGIRFPTG